ncbi:MAG: DUF1638 domain-containing protein [Spirochaetaceae bacterium]|jgi:hypothetical protein|nr:DUF1638 domain-containing protein [Spirochaetaceae bacterium]
MSLTCISCGIFRFELEKVLPEIKTELDCDVQVEYLDPGLDVHADVLEKAVSERLRAHADDDTALLYGSMCHTEWPRITEKSGATYPKPANCAEMLLSPEKKKEIDARGNVYYLTMGGLKLWKEIYQQGHGWDDADARQNFCYFEKIVVLDTGVFEIADEELFEFYEYTQVPVEVEKISLDHFKSVIKSLCEQRRRNRACP